MLILTRKPGESLWIGDKIKVVLVEMKGNQARLGIEAPPDVRIFREEIYLQILEENRSAAAPKELGSLDGLSAALGPDDKSSGTAQLLTTRKVHEGGRETPSQPRNVPSSKVKTGKR